MSVASFQTPGRFEKYPSRGYKLQGARRADTVGCPFFGSFRCQHTKLLTIDRAGKEMNIKRLQEFEYIQQRNPCTVTKNINETELSGNFPNQFYIA